MFHLYSPFDFVLNTNGCSLWVILGFFFFLAEVRATWMCAVFVCVCSDLIPTLYFPFWIRPLKGVKSHWATYAYREKANNHISSESHLLRKCQGQFFFSVALGNVGYVKNKTRSTFLGRSLKTFSLEKKESVFLLVCVWAHAFKRVIPIYLQMFSPWASLIAHLVKNPPTMETPGLIPGLGGSLQKG